MASTHDVSYAEPESYTEPTADDTPGDCLGLKAESSTYRPGILRDTVQAAGSSSSISSPNVSVPPTTSHVKPLGGPSLIHSSSTSPSTNTSSTNHPTTSSTKLPTTRRRVVQSCSECRRRKIKCDRKFPCGPCILRGDQSRCHEVDMNERRGIGGKSGTNAVVGASSGFTGGNGGNSHWLPSSSNWLVSSAEGQSQGLSPAIDSRYVSTLDHIALVHRVDALQHALLKAGLVVTHDIEEYLNLVRTSSTSSSSFSLTQNKQHAAGSISQNGGGREVDESLLGGGSGGITGDSTPPDEAEAAALTLEHLAFGRSQAEGSHAIPSFGVREPSNVARPAPENNYHLRRSTIGPGNNYGEMKPSGKPIEGAHSQSTVEAGEGVGGNTSYHGTNPDSSASDLLLTLLNPADILDVFWKRTDLINKTLAKLLPTPEIGRVVIQNYLDKVLWLHRCLHVPTFLRQCNDLWSMPPERATEEFTLGFLGIYFVALCLGLQFMDPKDAAKIFSAEDAKSLPDAWYNAARTANWAADFFGRHTLESVQCLIIMTVYMNNQDRADAAWAFLGGAIKMAQGMGLSRLGAEPTHSTSESGSNKKLAMWTGRWESLVERELGRRVWWNLVFLDWTLAPSYNYATSIQPDQIKTAKPANINDEDLSDSIPFRPQPSHVPTIMSYSLARIGLAEINHRQIWQANNNAHPPYSFVLSVDADMHRALRDVPAYLRLEVGKDHGADKVGENGDEEKLGEAEVMRRQYEKMGLHLAFYGRMLRLHRPFSSRGYTDEKYAYSKEQCIRAARAALRLMSADDGSAAYLEKWWIALFYVSISGMVVIIDLIRTPKKDLHSTETNEKVKEVKGALDQMRRVTGVSNARATLRVMDFLLAEFEERRNKILSQPISSTTQQSRGTKRKSSSVNAIDPLDSNHEEGSPEASRSRKSSLKGGKTGKDGNDDEIGGSGDIMGKEDETETAGANETLKKAIQELMKQAALESIDSSDSASNTTPGTDTKSPYASTGHERRVSESGISSGLAGPGGGVSEIGMSSGAGAGVGISGVHGAGILNEPHASHSHHPYLVTHNPYTNTSAHMGRSTTTTTSTATFHPNLFTGGSTGGSGHNAWGYQMSGSGGESGGDSKMQTSPFHVGPVFPPPQTPALDPTVEGILANFFSNPALASLALDNKNAVNNSSSAGNVSNVRNISNTNVVGTNNNSGVNGVEPLESGPSDHVNDVNNATSQLAQQQADDFLLKVFSFSWDQPQSRNIRQHQQEATKETTPGSATLTPVSGIFSQGGGGGGGRGKGGSGSMPPPISHPHHNHNQQHGQYPQSSQQPHQHQPMQHHQQPQPFPQQQAHQRDPGQNQGQGSGQWGLPTYDLGVGMGMNMDGWNTHGNAWIG